MTESEQLPGRIVGHEPGSFYNRLAQIAVETDLRPIGLSEHTPLRASWEPGQGHIAWRMHSAPLAATPCTWNPANAASSLTRDRLQAAYRRFLGRAGDADAPAYGQDGLL